MSVWKMSGRVIDIGLVLDVDARYEDVTHRHDSPVVR